MAYTIEMCEEIYGNGFADEISGDVEAPTGHFYRVHNCVVVTNSNGFSDLTEYPNEAEAIMAFLTLHDAYIEWCDDDEDAGAFENRAKCPTHGEVNAIIWKGVLVCPHDDCHRTCA